MRSSNTRFWLLLGVALVIVVLVVGGSGTQGPPLDPRSVSPDGARGVVDSLKRLGARVDIDGSTPAQGATSALLLQDRLSPDDRDVVLDWVANGGVLVVADLYSTLAADRAFGQVFSDAVPIRRGTCSIAAVQGAERVAVNASFVETEGADSYCFGDARGALIVAEQLGRGSVVTVGSTGLFTNAELDEDDAAVIALGLLAPNRSESHVAFLRPSVVDFGEEGLSDLVAPRVRNAIIQLLAAFLIYALFRARRLGGVVAEPVPVRIEGSELVLKSGLLSERAKDPASAAQVLRHEALARMRRSLSIPATADNVAIASRVGGHTGLDPIDVAETLISPVMSEAQLIAVAQGLTEIDRRLDATATAGASTSSPTSRNESPAS